MQHKFKFLSVHEAYMSEFAEHFKEVTKAADPQVVAGREDDVRVVGSVAIVPIHGGITHRAGWYTVGATDLNRVLQILDAEESIETIILDIDSPGGEVAGIPELAKTIRGMKSKTIAYAHSMAASAAYWLASQADEIAVTPSGEVGSIGVIAMHVDWSEFESNLGVKTTLVTAGRRKAELNPYSPLTEEARAALQQDVDAFYDMFVADVARGRGVSVKKVKTDFGEGGMLMAKEAKKTGMVDRIDTLDSIVSRETGSGKSRKFVVKRLKDVKGSLDDLEGGESEDSTCKEIKEKVTAREDMLKILTDRAGLTEDEANVLLDRGFSAYATPELYEREQRLNKLNG